MRAVMTICGVWMLLALSITSAQAASTCTGAGLPPDAPMVYLIPAGLDDQGNAVEPAADDTIPDKRQSFTAVYGRDDVDVLLYSRETAGDRALPYGVFIGLFRSVDLNGDAIEDFLIYEPAGAFYYVMLYAGCGEGYYTQVGAFDSREIPEPVRYVPVNGVKWAQYEVIAPDKTLRHADPLVNWARRTWSFDGKGYRQGKVEPIR